MKINEAFKIRLEQYLKERNLTIYKFAREGGIPRSTIVNAFRGTSKSPTLATIYQVANALGISALEFLDCDLFCDENVDF
jgi:transcriptional regulator with XRE-family HTH domain